MFNNLSVALMKSAGVERESLRNGLVKEMIRVHTPESIDECLQTCRENSVDVVIMDSTSGFVESVGVMRGLRHHRIHVGTFLIYPKNVTALRTQCIELRLDDFLEAPYDFSELMIRLRTLGRRNYATATPTFVIRDLLIDTRSVTVFCRGVALELTKSEYRILEYLAYKQGTVVSKEKLQELIEIAGKTPDSNVVEAMISTLRKKLSSGLNQNNCVIQTRRGFGYLIPDFADRVDENQFR